MKTNFITLLLAITAYGGEPSIVFDNRPESGIPLEAKAQERVDAMSHGTLAELVGDSIKSIRVRYFNKESWTSENQVKAYLAGLLTNKFTEVYTFQIWSQVVGEPEIECLIDFTDDHRNKLRGEHALYEGKLLLWGTAACYRDATGKWRFVTTFDYFHAHHPSGNRELSREKAAK